MKTLPLVLFACLLPLLCSAQWIEHTVATGFNDAACAQAVDLDGDGDLDIVGSAESELYVTWWENTDGVGTSWDEHSLPGVLYGVPVVCAADLDGDGDADVIAAYDYGDAVYWWENENGLGTDWDMNTVSSNMTDVQSVCPVDVDGDGDMDLAGSGEDMICWWENDNGLGTSWTEHVLNGPNGWRTHQVCAADVDGDTDMDLLAATWDGDQVLWWENLDGVGGSWSEHVIVSILNQAEGVHCADMNDDGYVDMLCFSSFTNEIFWYQNVDGSGTSWTQHELPITGYYFTSYLVAGDMDYDGDPDVLAVARSGGGICWWENVNSLGTEWIAHVVDAALGPSWVHAFDMTGDGDLDILVPNSSSDSILWYEREGSPEPDPVELTLTPTSATTFPPTGGTLEYTVHLVSNLAIPVAGITYWTDVVLPSGGTYGPLMTQGFTMSAFMDVTVPGLTQTIPAMAPAGVYQFRGHVGFMAGPQVGDSFPFTKLESAADGEQGSGSSDFAEWQAGGSWTLAGELAVNEQQNDLLLETMIPSDDALAAIHPNPFNESATVTVELPEVSELTVAVYNVTGKRVTELVRGRVAAGTHSFTFDGQSLASGVYFVSASVSGKLESTQKIVLMR